LYLISIGHGSKLLDNSELIEERLIRCICTKWFYDSKDIY